MQGQNWSTALQGMLGALQCKVICETLHAGDERTAEDAYQFLQGFLRRFPEYAGRQFWVAGESYGGHYVPNLALKVL